MKLRSLDPEYAARIVASMAPLVTLDAEQRIRFVNESFEREFKRKGSDLAGLPLLDVLPLRFADRETLIDTVTVKGRRKRAGREFRFGRQVYGYTVFPVGDDTGIILKNITDIKRLERKVETLHSQLLRVQDEERQRLAAELHDGVGQTVLAAKINIVAFAANPQKNGERLQLGLELIDRASNELREIYSNLYPSLLRELGLASAIRERLRALEATGLAVETSIALDRRLPPDLELQIYRIVQEVIANALKHASARRFTLSLSDANGQLHLAVADDGVGFSPNDLPSGGFGLQNIRRRVEDCKGHMQLISFPAGGASLEVRVPLGADGAQRS